MFKDRNAVFVHFTGWAEKYNMEVDCDSDSIRKQWSKGDSFKVHNRLDIKDEINVWREAIITQINGKQLRIHYRGFTQKFDEDIGFDSDRIAEIGTFSKAYGRGNIIKRKRMGLKSPQHLHDEEEDQELRVSEIEILRRKQKRDEQNAQLSQALASKGLKYVTMGGDGNCLFRAISHQLYGTEDHHEYIRN